MIAEPDVHARLHALELHGEGARVRHHYCCPIRFVSREKLTRHDKLLLAFDAFAFSRATGKLPAVAKIVYGQRYSTVKVALGKPGCPPVTVAPRVRAISESAPVQRLCFGSHPKDGQAGVG